MYVHRAQSGYSHDSQALVEKPHWHRGGRQQHAGQASLEMAFKKPTSKRDARLKWGTENSVARQPTFAKAEATDVYLFKGGGERGGGTGPVKVWTKREDDRKMREERHGEKERRGTEEEWKRNARGTGKCPICVLLDWRERLNRLQWGHEAFPSLQFPRIGKEPGYTVGLQSNGAVTSALVKTVLWQMHRQTSRPAENQQGRHVRTVLAPAQWDNHTLHSHENRHENTDYKKWK